MEQYEIIYDWCGEESEECNLTETFTELVRTARSHQADAEERLL